MKLNLKLKLILSFSILILLISAGLGSYSIYTVRSKINATAVQKLSGDLKSAKSILDLQYPGNWEIKENKLYKGSQLINDQFDIVDNLGTTTGNNVTIFQKGTRVNTNIIVDGKRMIGTPISEEVGNVVLKEGRTYTGIANVLGVKNHSAYEPIKNGDGEIIGILFVGLPNTLYENMISAVIRNIVIFVLIAIVVATSYAFFFSTQLINRIRRIVNTVTEVAKGDLRSRIFIKANDELGNLTANLNLMLDNMEKVLGDVKRSSAQVMDAANQLNLNAGSAADTLESMNENIQELANSAVEQQQNSEKATILMSEISDGIQLVTGNIQSVSETSVQVTTSAHDGRSSLSKAMQQMEVIDNTVNQVADKVRTLGNLSKEIVQIIDVITGIADQTALLSLNAAIEAARAGEQGKGFAVVAEEVRKLAEQSGQSAQQIESLIRRIETETNSSVESMNLGINEVKKGVTVINVAAQAFDSIVDSIETVSSQLQEVSASTTQIEANSSEMLDIVQEANNGAHKTAEIAQESSSSSEQEMALSQEVAGSANVLRELADHLDSIVQTFQLNQ